jgi:hypothetical protein
MHTALRKRAPAAAASGSDPERGQRGQPATERGGLYGCDGGKKVHSTKRRLLVDTLGYVLLVCVSPATVDDRDSVEVLLCQTAEAFPRLQHIWADQGDLGVHFHAGIRETTGITVQIVQRRDSGFRHAWAKARAPACEVPAPRSRLPDQRPSTNLRRAAPGKRQG